MTEDLEDSVNMLQMLREQRKALDERINATQSNIIRHMTATGDEKLFINSKIITLVHPVRRIVDEHGLRSAIDDEVWNRITKRVYDQRLADVAVEEGLVPFLTLHQFIRIQPLAAYIKVTGG